MLQFKGIGGRFVNCVYSLSCKELDEKVDTTPMSGEKKKYSHVCPFNYEATATDDYGGI